MPNGGQKLSFRLFGRGRLADQPAVGAVRHRLARGRRHRGRSRRSSSEDALTEIIGEGNFDMFEWGWVVEPDPNYQLSTFTCANRSYKDGGSVYAEPLRLVLLRRGVRRALRAAGRADRPGGARGDRQGDAEDALRRRPPTSSRSTTTTCRPTAPTGSPASSRSRRRTGRCCSSTAPRSYQSIRPVTEDDATGGGGAARTPQRRTTTAARGGHRGARGGAGRPGRRRVPARARPAAAGARCRVGRGGAGDAGAGGRRAAGGPARRRAGRSPVRRPGAVRRPPGAHRRGHAWCSSWSSTSSCSGCCPATRSRSTPAAATWTASSCASCAGTLNEPIGEQFVELPEEPVLHRRRLDPVLPAGVGRDRRLRRADAGAAAAPRPCSSAVIGIAIGHQGRLEARQPLRPARAPASPSPSTRCRSSGSAWCCSSCSAPASGRSRASSRAAGPSRRGWTRPRSRACSTGLAPRPAGRHAHPGLPRGVRAGDARRRWSTSSARTT